jgi:hypothetical protein
MLCALELKYKRQVKASAINGFTVKICGAKIAKKNDHMLRMFRQKNRIQIPAIMAKQGQGSLALVAPKSAPVEIRQVTQKRRNGFN